MNQTPDDVPTGLGPVEVPPASEVVVRHLKRAIHLGLLAPGSKLPPERELALMLNVSRSTVREALHQAKGEGYVEIRRGKGGGVSVRANASELRDLPAWFAAHENDVESIFEYRIAVEGLAARRAATRMSDDQLDQLAEETVALANASTIAEFRLHDLRFHSAVARASDMLILERSVEEARAALFLPFQPLTLVEMQARSVKDHEKIVSVLRARDPKRAERAMATHLRSLATSLTPGD